jgi:hypothetical protein
LIALCVSVAESQEYVRHPKNIRSKSVSVRRMTEAVNAQDSPRKRRMRGGNSEGSPVRSIETEVTESDSPQTKFTANAPKLLIGFEGLGATDFDPPDPTVAAGPDHVVVAVNSVLGVFSKTPERIFRTSFRNWFAALPDAKTASFFDCRILYDQYEKHFIVMSLAAVFERTYCFLAVSKTADAMGEWAMWDFDFGLNGNKPNNLDADFPGLGVDPVAVYITANMYDAKERFKYSKIRILSKSELYGFENIGWKDFFNFTDATDKNAINVQPAQSFGPTNVEYLVSSGASRGNQLTIFTITNADKASATLSKKIVNVPPFQNPPHAIQKGGKIPIYSGDAGVGNVIFRNGFLYTAHSVLQKFDSGNGSAIRYYQISNEGKVLQQIRYGAEHSFFYFPATMVDSQGNVVIAFNSSGPNQFASFSFTGRKRSDPEDTFAQAAAVQEGLSFYRNDPDLNDWGEFNGIALDPDDSFWLFGEFAKSKNEWSTEIAHLTYAK